LPLDATILGVMGLRRLKTRVGSTRLEIWKRLERREESRALDIEEDGVGVRVGRP